MKLNFTVDLDDKDILGEDLIEAIRGEARKISREVISKEIHDEVNRIAEAWVSDKSSGWHEGNLDRVTRIAIRDAVKEEIEKPSNESIFSDLLVQAKDSLRKDIESYTKTEIENQVKEQLPKAFFDIMKGARECL